MDTTLRECQQYIDRVAGHRRVAVLTTGDVLIDHQAMRAAAHSWRTWEAVQLVLSVLRSERGKGNLCVFPRREIRYLRAAIG